MTQEQQKSTSALSFRSGRFFKINGEWYFATRESFGHGPFVDRASAEKACRRFVEGKQRPSRARHTG